MPSLLTVMDTLQLAVGDMVREVRNLRDALDTTSEISKIAEISPKRDRRVTKLIVCPTHLRNSMADTQI